MSKKLIRYGDYYINPATRERLTQWSRLYLGYDEAGRKLALSLEPGAEIVAQVLTDRLGNHLQAEPAMTHLIKSMKETKRGQSY